MPATALLQSATPGRNAGRSDSTPEFDLLLACCADQLNSDRAEQIGGILAQPLDWERLLHLAEHHGVNPQVYLRLSAADRVPAGPIKTLSQAFQRNARQTLWLTRELLRILEHLQSRGLAVLPYKGPVLAEVLYGNVTARQFSDLDLLVHTADVAAIKAALLELGYVPGTALTARQERAHLGSGYEYTFDSPHGGNLLEIQWQMLPRFYAVGLDVDSLFRRAILVSVAGKSMPALSPEDLILVLCVHAAKHMWVQLSWLCDIACAAQSQPIDWPTVVQRAEHLGIERIVNVTFLLAHQLLGAALPLTIATRLQHDPVIGPRANEIAQIIRSEKEISTESISYFKMMMRLRERWQDRALFLWRLAVTPSIGEWSAVRLPTPLFPLYRVVRLFRLAARLAP